MKLNVQIYNVPALAAAVARHLENKLGQKITYKTDSCYLDEDGTFHFIMLDSKTETFSYQQEFTAKDIAEMIYMPTWEVVTVPNYGGMEYSIMFYEEG